MCVQSQFIPIWQLWDGFNPYGVKKGIFVFFKGYIDESYDQKQKLFTLSCISGKGSAFLEMGRMWKLRLHAKNKQLAREGRKQISRYHATDCNARYGEFHGWEKEERNEFVLKLFEIF